MKTRHWLTAFVVFLVACTSNTEKIEEAKAAFKAGENVKGLAILQKLADEDVPDALNTLGAVYFVGGAGVETDLAKSFSYFKRSADLGNADGQYQIGLSHVTGDYVERDIEEALRWFRMAADQGHPEADKDAEKLSKAIWMSRTGWVAIPDICAGQKALDADSTMNCDGPVAVTGRGIFQYWAGEAKEFYFNRDTQKFERIKVRITWVTDRSPYSCGQVVDLGAGEVKDFNFRAWALEKC
jgi:hypothetical protein